MTGRSNITQPQKGMRLFRICTLIDAIRACEWEDVKEVMTAYLDEARVGFPPSAQDKILEPKNPKLWNDLMSFEDIRDYYIACGIEKIRKEAGKAADPNSETIQTCHQ